MFENQIVVATLGFQELGGPVSKAIGIGPDTEFTARVDPIDLVEKRRIGRIIKIKASDKILVVRLFRNIGIEFQKIVQLTLQFLTELGRENIFEFESGEVKFSVGQNSLLRVALDQFCANLPV